MVSSLILFYFFTKNGGRPRLFLSSLIDRLSINRRGVEDRWKRHIPLELSSCVTYLEYDDETNKLKIANFDVSKEEFVKSLPLVLQHGMERRIKEFEKKFKEVQEETCQDHPFYCQFQLNNVVFQSQGLGSLMAVCAMCESNFVHINEMLNTPRQNLTIEARGGLNFTIQHEGPHGEPWPVNFTRDELVLEVKTFNPSLVTEAGSGVEMLMQVDDEHQGVMQLHYQIFPGVDFDEKMVNMARDPPAIKMTSFYSPSDPMPPLYAPKHVAEDGFFQRQATGVRLVEWVGNYLSYCSRVFVELYAGRKESYLCGRIYFLDGTSGDILKQIHGARTLTPMSEVEPKLGKCDMEVIKMIIAGQESGLFEKHAAMIVCLCKPSLNNTACDESFDQDVLNQTTLQQITQTKCEEGGETDHTTQTGLFGYCLFTLPTWFAARTIVERETHQECWKLNHETPAAWHLDEGFCYYCCLATAEKPCNLEFVQGGKLYYMTLNCENAKKFGLYNRTSPNFAYFPRELPYAEEVRIQRADLMDVNFEFDGLLGYFHLDLQSLSVRKIATINPAAHAYFEHQNSSYKSSLDSGAFNNWQLALCSYANWTVAHMAQGCKCYTTNQTEQHCCCLKEFLGTLLSVTSSYWSERKFQIAEEDMENHWWYRETMAVNMTVTEEE
ncbi:unnamed protein product [Bursaphelenchus xylophilus]|uniref:(pine wood nematode) hypothetical protein n=1 Tax=Bursaphelenchus xylophilus TaxID=6326 RepID=A0A1I7RQN4_BURXY|nr:unnamed protein product [Bursaphelenchus xylophilus]CAG9104861.1 unnamed protein product [Bursaphelenchus xylophilus]